MLEAQLGYDIGKHALTTSLTASRKVRGKELELKAAWAEQTGQWVLGTLVKPHPNHKLAGTYVPLGSSLVPLCAMLTAVLLYLCSCGDSHRPASPWRSLHSWLLQSSSLLV